MKRRQFITTTAIGVLTAAVLSESKADAEAQQPLPPWDWTGDDESKIPPVVLEDCSLSWVKGFNYQPSYASHGLDIWVDLNEERIDYELKRGKELFPEMTAIRIWLSADAYWKVPDVMPKNVRKVLDIASAIGLKALPCMTSGWHGIPDFGGVTRQMVTYEPLSLFFPYFDNVILPLKDHEAVIGWDLCNEPGGDRDFLRWLTTIHDHLKQQCPELKTTIGIANSPDLLPIMNPLCDFLSDHPYFATPDRLKMANARLNRSVRYANAVKKPLLATEICIGRMDDMAHAQVFQDDLPHFNARKIGFLIHALWHSRVADLHRPEYGPVCAPGYMACIEPDGTLRKGHEVINQYL